MSFVALLGPQRHQPIVRRVLDEQGLDGPLAVVTGGWEEREGELHELEVHVERPTVNLRLAQRLQSVLAIDEAFAQALVDRNDRLRTAQRFYRRRLASLLESVRDLYALPVPRSELLVAERDDALRAVGALDAHYLRQIRGIHEAFLDLWEPRSRPAVAELREHIAAEVGDCEAVLIAGGHVGSLLDQVSLLDLRALFAAKPIVAWSAGAMLCCEHIVLFHDSPPQGPSDPELYDDGLGVAPGVVALPHASLRLRLDDTLRVEMFARRFAPRVCLALDAGCGARWDGSRWEPIGPLRCLAVDGRVAPVEAAW
ncbi:MAG: hypothetical protein D6731_03710 [Planctomycetota bacterium]|nr:MAG: hypothetical protein D6731_03710 [Planctomycetota bacterium]